MITQEQLKDLRSVKTALESTRESEKGDMWLKIKKYVLPELLSHTEPKKKILSDRPRQYTTLATNALQGWAYGRSISWMHLAVEDKDQYEGADDNDVTEWLQECERIMMADLSRSHFYDEAQSFTDIVLNLSTGIMLLDWDEKTQTFITQNINPCNCCIDEDGNNFINTLFYEFEITARKARTMFKENCPEKLKKAKDSSTRYKFVKALLKAEDWDIDVPGEDPWIEVIYFEDDQSKTVSERRMNFQPFICWRFARSLTGSAWGVGSAGESCINTIEYLNLVEKAKLKGLQLRNDPPVKATEGLELNIKPAGITYVSGRQDFAFAPPPSNTEEIESDIAKKEQILREAYYVDFFLVLQQTMENHKTATEASLLADEKSQIMASFTARLHNEFLEPLLETLFAMEVAHGRLPEPPIPDIPLKIDYISPLDIAQKKAQLYAPAKQFVNETFALAQVEPSVRYVFKIGDYVDAMAKDLMIDQRFIRDKEEVNKMMQQDRQMQMQQMQQQNQSQQIADATNAYTALSKAPEENSPMSNMAGGMNG